MMDSQLLSGRETILTVADDGGFLTVPGGDWLLRADFLHQGPDLVVLGGNGQQVVVPDFFASDAPPDLRTEGGQVISADLAKTLAGPLAPGQLAQAALGAQAQSIGRVETLNGTVEVTRSDGTKVTLAHGDAIFQGDVLETGADSAVGLVLADDSTFSLAANGRMVMDELTYDPDGETGSAMISVVQGIFSFVSGQIAKVGPDAMVLNTPVAVIGVRGTKVAGQAAAEGELNTISLLPDADGSVGELIISNSFGVQVLNVAGATLQLTSAFQAPPPPVVLPIQQIEQQFSTALSSLPPTPSSSSQNGSNDNRNEDQQDEPEEAEGEQAEGEGEGEEGEAQGDAAPEGGEEDLAAAAFRQAIESGASQEEAFAAAAAAAARQALTEGASPEEVAAAIEAAREAYLQALANGLTPEQALAAAAAAAEEVAGGDFPDDQDDDGDQQAEADGDGFGDIDQDSDIDDETIAVASDDPPPPGSGTDQDGDGEPSDGFHFSFDGNDFFDHDISLFGGAGDDILDFSLNFDFDAFFDLGIDFTYEEFLDDGFVFFEDDYVTDGFVELTEVFDEVKVATTGDDTLVGDASLNTNFYFSYSSGVGGTDTITDGGGQNQMSFDSLDDVKIKFTMGDSPDSGTVSIWADYDGAAASSESTVTSSISFSGVTQYLFSDISAGSLQGDYTAYSEIDLSADSAPVDESGDIVVMPSLLSGDVGYVYAGSGTDDIFNLDLTSDGVIVFGKGGGDTFNISTAMDGLFIGGITSSDNLDTDDDGIPDTGINAFDYSSMFSGTTGLAVHLSGFFGESSGDGVVSENVADSSLHNMLWDVGKFTASAGDDVMTIEGGAYWAIEADAGDDAISVISSIYSGNAKMNYLDAGAGNDTISLAAGTIVKTSIDGGTGTDSLTLGDGGNSFTILDVETIYGGSGDDSLTINGTSATSITGAAGNDTLILDGSAVHTAIFSTAWSNGTDILKGFATGSGGDVLSLSGLGLDGIGGSASGTSAVIVSNDGGLIGGTTAVVFHNSFFSGVDSTSSLSSQIDSFVSFLDSTSSLKGSFSAYDQLVFVIDDSSANNDVSLLYWNDSDGDANVISGEISQIAIIDNIDITTLDSTANFV